MSKRELNAIVFYLLDAIITNNDIPLTSSLPEEIQEDFQFAAELKNIDLSGESRIRQKLRNQLQKQTAMQAHADQMFTGNAKPARSTGAAVLSVGLGAAAVVMAALLIFLRPPKTTGAGETAPEERQEITAVEMVSQVS
ncbi:MAG: hypothetical protein RBT34_10810 [Anaerolineaceae bacterium]|jgi:hypothetical protein|nr:hypothetical protein [Anaerolineaceae bacterium]